MSHVLVDAGRAAVFAVHEVVQVGEGGGAWCSRGRCSAGPWR